MMPKNKIGRHMMAKLKLFVGPNHTHQAQCPIPLEALSGRPTPAGALFVTPPKPKESAVEAAVPTDATPTIQPDVASSPPESSEA
jgi:large subunit ribosomal protein L13